MACRASTSALRRTESTKPSLASVSVCSQSFPLPVCANGISNSIQPRVFSLAPESSLAALSRSNTRVSDAPTTTSDIEARVNNELVGATTLHSLSSTPNLAYSTLSTKEPSGSGRLATGVGGSSLQNQAILQLPSASMNGTTNNSNGKAPALPQDAQAAQINGPPAAHLEHRDPALLHEGRLELSSDGITVLTRRQTSRRKNTRKPSSCWAR